jgi:IstB-like ATP binding protein
MKEQTQALEHASVKQYCKALRIPMIGAHFVQLAEQASKEQRSHIGYLEALLTMESEERDRHAIQQRLRDAKLPRLKTLEEFDFNQARQIPAAKIRELSEGGYRFRRYCTAPSLLMIQWFSIPPDLYLGLSAVSHDFCFVGDKFAVLRQGFNLEDFSGSSFGFQSVPDRGG